MNEPLDPRDLFEQARRDRPSDAARERIWSRLGAPVPAPLEPGPQRPSPHAPRAGRASVTPLKAAFVGALVGGAVSGTIVALVMSHSTPSAAPSASPSPVAPLTHGTTGAVPTQDLAAPAPVNAPSPAVPQTLIPHASAPPSAEP